MFKCPERLEENRRKIMDLDKEMQAHGLYVFFTILKSFYTLSFLGCTFKKTQKTNICAIKYLIFLWTVII